MRGGGSLRVALQIFEGVTCFAGHTGLTCSDEQSRCDAEQAEENVCRQAEWGSGTSRPASPTSPTIIPAIEFGCQINPGFGNVSERKSEGSPV